MAFSVIKAVSVKRGVSLRADGKCGATLTPVCKHLSNRKIGVAPAFAHRAYRGYRVRRRRWRGVGVGVPPPPPTIREAKFTHQQPAQAEH